MIEKRVIAKLKELNAPLAVVFPSDKNYTPPQLADTPILVLKTRKALWHLAARDIGALGDDYVNGDVDLHGSPSGLMRAVSVLVGNEMAFRKPTLLERAARKFHSIERDKKNVQSHYDVSDDFYKLWLDSRRVYSCAYYGPTSTLEEAQARKLDYVCRKLDLQPNEEFLDIGMGWGGLLIHAAENYGVRATGITLSKNQHAYVSQLIKERGLTGLVKVELKHYQDLTIPQKYVGGQLFDKIASIGMSEHVGTAQLPTYFNRLRLLLKPSGMLLNHCITACNTAEGAVGNGMGQFIGKHIFPGGELQHTSEVLRVAADAGLEMVDTENLRTHYARTCWDWSENLEANLIPAIAIAGVSKVRAYRMYLAGSALGFEKNWMALHQFLFIREATPYSFNREYMYRQV